jgi:uncharacterized caspase-like protein/Tfp pilus assembly protein PilF
MKALDLVILLLSCCLPFTVSAGNKVARTQVQGGGENKQARAVVIGVSDYQDERVSDLRFANRDATEFATFLRSSSAWEIPEDQLMVLVDTSATLAAIQDALAWQQRDVSEGETALIYFAGHGDIEATDKAENGYLLAHDTPGNNYKLLALSVNYLNRHIDSLNARGAKVILIIDACHAGVLAGDVVNGRQFTSNKLLQRQQEEIRILSCQPYEKAEEFDELGGGRGAFSYYLQEALSGKADEDTNREIDLFELETYLRKNVRQKTHSSQHPEIVGGRISQAFVSVSKAGKEANLQAKLNRSREDLLAATIKSAPDTSQTNYKLFELAFKRKRFFGSDGTAAHDFYLKMRDDPALADLQLKLSREIAVSLLDSVQQAINAYLDTDPGELVQREQANSKYEVFPAYLAAVAEIISPRDPRYEETIAKKRYFEGLVLRITAAQSGWSEANYQLAKGKIRGALEIAPDAPYIHNEMGLLHDVKQELDSAYYSFRAAMTLAPTWALAINNFAANFKAYGEEQFADSKYYYEQAIQLKPNFPTARMNYGNLLMDMGRQTEAEAQLRIALELGPEFIDAYYNLAICICDVPGKQAEAKALFGQVLRRNPDYVSAYNGLGLTNDYLKQPDSAAYFYTTAVESGRTNFEKPFIRIRELLPPEAAVASYKKALSVDPDIPNAYAHWAIVEPQSNAWSVALRNSTLPTARKQDILNHAGDWLNEVKDYPAAEKAYRLGLSVDDQNLESNLKLVAHYLKRNDLPAAQKAVKWSFRRLSTKDDRIKMCKAISSGDIYQPLREQSAYQKISRKHCSDE